MNPAADPSDERAFAGLVRELERPIGSFLAQKTSDRALAADLMQESFLVAWRERARAPKDPAQRRAWLYAVARHRALSAVRKRRRGTHALGRLLARIPAEPKEPPADEAIAMRDLLVRTLRPADRSLFVLRYVITSTAPNSQP
jgi:RNA polymerase sigma-70 factor (ECF subfamily)